MKKLWYLSAIVILAAACDKNISDFQSQNFIKYYGGGEDAFGYDIMEISDGYILTGYNKTAVSKNQVFAIRTDRAGNSRWQREYGTSHNEEGRVVKTDNESFYVVGITTFDITGIRNSFLLKLDFNGDTAHYKSFGLPSYSLVINDFVVDESFVYLVGESYEASPTQPNYFVAKYSLTGEPGWQRTITAQGNQRLNKVFLKNDGRIIAVGTNSQVVGSTHTHISLVEFSNQGVPISSSNLSALSNHFFGDALFDGENLTIAYNVLEQSVYVARVISLSAANYTPIWHIETGISAEGKALAQTNGVLTLCGERDDTIHLYQFDSAGNLTLTSNQIKNLAGYVHSIIPTSDKGWALIGTTAPDYGTMMQLIKTDKDLFLFEL